MRLGILQGGWRRVRNDENGDLGAIDHGIRVNIIIMNTKLLIVIIFWLNCHYSFSQNHSILDSITSKVSAHCFLDWKVYKQSDSILVIEKNDKVKIGKMWKLRREPFAIDTVTYKIFIIVRKDNKTYDYYLNTLTQFFGHLTERYEDKLPFCCIFLRYGK